MNYYMYIYTEPIKTYNMKPKDLDNQTQRNQYAESTAEKIERARHENVLMKALEKLVHRRFNKKGLEAELSSIFGHKAKVSVIGQDNLEATDHNFLTSFDNEAKGLFGYADIYFLKMRRKGFDGSTFLVTEVSYQFE